MSLSKRKISILVVCAASLGALALMYHLRSVFNPFLLAIALAYILNPAINAMEKRRIPRKLGIGIIFCSLLIFIIAATVGIVPKAIHEAEMFMVEVTGEPFDDLNEDGIMNPESESGTWKDLNKNGKFEQGYIQLTTMWLKRQKAEGSFTRRYLEKFVPAEQLDTYLTNTADAIKNNMKSLFNTISNTAGKVMVNLWRGGLKSVGWLWDVAFIALLTPVYLAFLLNSLSGGWNLFTSYIPSDIRPRTLNILGQIDMVIGAFFRGRLLVCLAIGIFTALGFWICGVRFGLLFGLLIGILSFIPFINVLGFAPALLTCWFDGFGLWGYVAVFAVYSIGQGLDPLLTTLIMGKDLQLHPVTILLSLFACSALFGFFGMLLAVPIVATLKIIAKEFLLPHMEELARQNQADAATGEG